MRPTDLVSYIGLAVGLVLAVVVGILLRRKIIPLERMPSIIGIGGFIFGFAFLILSSLTYRRPTEIVDYTAWNFVLAASIALGGYVTAAVIVRRNGGH